SPAMSAAITTETGATRGNLPDTAASLLQRQAAAQGAAVSGRFPLVAPVSVVIAADMAGLHRPESRVFAGRGGGEVLDMSDVAIRVEGLSKLYRLGAREGYKTLRDTISSAV